MAKRNKTKEQTTLMIYINTTQKTKDWITRTLLKYLYMNTFSNLYMNTFSNLYMNTFSNLYLNTFSNLYMNTFSNLYMNTFSNLYMNTFSNLYMNTFSNLYMNTFSNLRVCNVTRVMWQWYNYDQIIHFLIFTDLTNLYIFNILF